MNREKRLNPEKREILKPIEAIGFDLGGILFPDLHAPVVGEMAQKLGISEEVALQAFEKVYLQLAVDRKGATENDLWNKLRRASLKEVSMEELRNLYRSYLVPDRKVLSLIKKLAKNYPLFVVSNTIQPWLDYELDHYNLRQFFVEIVSSVKAEARKPKPKFFEFLLKKAKCPSEAFLFIDDSKRNTDAASEFGFQTIVYKDLPSLKTELTKRGVVFE